MNWNYFPELRKEMELEGFSSKEINEFNKRYNRPSIGGSKKRRSKRKRSKKKDRKKDRK